MIIKLWSLLALVLSITASAETNLVVNGNFGPFLDLLRPSINDNATGYTNYYDLASTNPDVVYLIGTGNPAYLPGKKPGDPPMTYQQSAQINCGILTGGGSIANYEQVVLMLQTNPGFFNTAQGNPLQRPGAGTGGNYLFQDQGSTTIGMYEIAYYPIPPADVADFAAQGVYSSLYFPRLGGPLEAPPTATCMVGSFPDFYQPDGMPEYGIGQIYYGPFYFPGLPSNYSCELNTPNGPPNAMDAATVNGISTNLICNPSPVTGTVAITGKTTITGTAINNNAPGDAVTIEFYRGPQGYGGVSAGTATTNPSNGTFHFALPSPATPGQYYIYANPGNGEAVDFLGQGYIRGNLSGLSEALAVGLDSGPASEVRVFDPQNANQVVFQSYPFGSGFTGGVRVALADVNHDGIPDVIVGNGPGITNEVVAFSGADGSVLWTKYPGGGASGIYVAAGDVNNDGYADIIVGYGSGAPEVIVYSGKDGSLLMSFDAFAPAYGGGVRVAAGDVNADGYADVIASQGPSGIGKVYIYSGGPAAVTGAPQVIGWFYSFGSSYELPTFVASADVNGDGHADIIVSKGDGVSSEVEVISGASITGGSASSPSQFSLLTLFPPYPNAESFTGGTRVTTLGGNIALVPGPGMTETVSEYGALTGATGAKFLSFPSTITTGAFTAGWH